MKPLLLLCLLACLLGILKTQETYCDDQIFNYYDQLGTQYRVNATNPLLQPIRYEFITEGIIELTISLESIARIYQAQVPSLDNTTPAVVNYVSFDYPYCVTSIQVICGGPLLRNLPKTDLCEVVDFDTGDPQTGGRVFIYNQEATNGTVLQGNCTGDIVVRLFGPMSLFQNASFIYTTFTYSVTGLLPGDLAINLTYPEAVSEYQNSLCAYTNGILPFPLPGQQELVCRVDPIVTLQPVCLSQRPSTAADPLLPIPQFACRGPMGGNDTRLVWFITVYGQPNATNDAARYGIGFCESYNMTCRDSVLSCTEDPVFCDKLTFAGTRNQYISLFSDFESGIMLSFLNNVTFTRPIYPFSVTDPFIRDIPCICGLSMDCGPDGIINTGLRGEILKPNNAYPVANASGNIFILPGQQSVVLDASASYDPDNGPEILSFYWKVYNSTPTPIDIPNPSLPTIIVSGNFVVGLYRFIVYVSDGQQVVFDIVNVTVVENIIRIVLPYYVEVQWQLVTECPPDLASLLAVSYPLNGSGTFGLNPAIPLFYNWTQIAGSNITVPYECNPETVDYYNVEAFLNTDKPIANVVFPSYGVYTFRLTVSDNNVSMTQYQDIQVSVELNFVRPNNTDRNYTDYPDAPTYNITNRSVPTITFPPVSQAPVNDLTRSPSFNDPVTTPIPAPLPLPNGTQNNITTTSPITILPDFDVRFIFPRLPEPSAAQWGVFLIGVIGVVLLFILLAGAMIAFLPYDYVYSRWDRIKVSS
jgi:hypothetical protein